MKLPSARIEPAPLLFPESADLPIKTLAETRNLCGEFFEKVTAALTGAKRLRTDATCDICPDALHGSDTYFEIKSCGKNATALIYRINYERQTQLTGNGRPLFYWFWHHRADVTKSPTRFALDRQLAESFRWLIVLPFSEIIAELSNRKLRTLCAARYTPGGKINGYSDQGYGSGWAVPLTALVRRCTHSFSLSGVSLPSATVRPFTAFGTESVAPLFEGKVLLYAGLSLQGTPD